MELRNLTDNTTDYLDAYCDAEVGHTNWAFAYNTVFNKDRPEVRSVIIIYNNPEEEAHEDA